MADVLHLFNVFGARTERTWLKVTAALHERGYRVHCAYETEGEVADAFALPRTRLERIHVTPTDDPAGQMDAIASYPADPALRELLDRPVDLVHGHFGPRMLHGAAWLKRGAPMVVSLYGYDATRLLRDRTWIGRYRWAAEHGATFVVLCEAMKRRLVGVGLPDASIEIVHIGVEPEEWPFDPRPAPDPLRFVFVGRMTEKKAPLDLIEAMHRLRVEHGIEASLDMIGDGPLMEAVRARVDELGLRASVRLHGSVGRERVRAMMQSATALVLPSVEAADGDCEGTPVVLMEALALGTPCITTDHSGNPEVLPPAASRWVVPEHDPAALARAMAALAVLPAEDRAQLQRAGRAWIGDNFNMAQTIDQYQRLYERLISA